MESQLPPLYVTHLTGYVYYASTVSLLAKCAGVGRRQRERHGLSVSVSRHAVREREPSWLAGPLGGTILEVRDSGGR